MNLPHDVHAFALMLLCLVPAHGDRPQKDEIRGGNTGFAFTSGGEVTEGDPATRSEETLPAPTTDAFRSVDTVEISEAGKVWTIVGSGMTVKTPDGGNVIPAGVRTRVPLKGKVAAGNKGSNHSAPASAEVLLIHQGVRPEQLPGIWGASSLYMFMIAVPVVSILILLASRRSLKG